MKYSFYHPDDFPNTTTWTHSHTSQFCVRVRFNLGVILFNGPHFDWLRGLSDDVVANTLRALQLVPKDSKLHSALQYYNTMSEDKRGKVRFCYHDGFWLCRINSPTWFIFDPQSYVLNHLPEGLPGLETELSYRHTYFQNHGIIRHTDRVVHFSYDAALNYVSMNINIGVVLANIDMERLNDFGCDFVPLLGFDYSGWSNGFGHANTDAYDVLASFYALGGNLTLANGLSLGNSHPDWGRSLLLAYNFA